MQLPDIIKTAIDPVLKLLPAAMDSAPARVMLLSIGQQESGFTARRQMGGGPARGFWQFEQGTASSRGGVWGVYLHPSTRYWLSQLSAARNVKFDPVAIYNVLENDDVLAAGIARLMLFTDPAKLPAVDDSKGSWALYARTWRPGKPRPETWDGYHSLAAAAVTQ